MFENYLLEHENRKCRYYRLLLDGKKYFKKEYKEINNVNVSMLKNELEILNKLNGVNVPKIREINYDKCYVIYGYIEGNTLLNKINGTLYEKILIFKKVCLELKKVHDYGIIHCDIKPSNIFFHNNMVHIIDFDNACYENGSTRYGSLLYCSPEQIKRQILDRRSDIYSLGIIFYELITNNRMFNNYGVEQLNVKSENDIKKIYIENNNIGDEINNIIKKCTYDDRNKRYSNIEELIIDVDKLLNTISFLLK